MIKIACFLALLMELRSHNTYNQENKYMEIYRTILCINICNQFHDYIKLNLKFHDYSSFYTALTWLHIH